MRHDFSNIANIRLAAGAHDHPNGDMCANEAAIIAAGFEYKKVLSAHDCPPCFSRPISAYAIRLNDTMPDDLRQGLLKPFATRLAGTADTPAMESKRRGYIARTTVNRILPIICRIVLKNEELALLCEAAETLDMCEKAALTVKAAADAALLAAAHTAAYAYAAAASEAYTYATAAADAAAAAPTATKEIYTVASEILDGAILLGNHTELEIVGPREQCLLGLNLTAVRGNDFCAED